MPKKYKVKNVMVKPITNHDIIQINIPKNLEDEKKIKPEKVFEGYKQSNHKQSNISKATKKKKK
jgi:broad specificity polyphosphatase/5'/3'-nucleotidase SurE